MRLVTLNYHLDEFHSVKGLNLQKQLTALLTALYQILHHCTFLSLPAEPEGTMHRLSDLNFFNIHFLYYVSAVQNVRRAGGQHATHTHTHAKSPAAADLLRQKLPRSSHDMQTPLVLQQESKG